MRYRKLFNGYRRMPPLTSNLDSRCCASDRKDAAAAFNRAVMLDAQRWRTHMGPGLKG
ncbi:MAG: hypothetical protein ABIT36_05615 [Steroidobacteraceae bacterium]